MFTGIIQNQGKVIRREKRGGQIHFAFRLIRPAKLKLGESIAVNGVCLTATKLSRNGFECDVIQETLKATTLGFLQVEDSVNLERSLKVGDEIGGHFVTGHVDEVGRIERIHRMGKNRTLTIKASPSLMRFLAVKGSIAVDGISLTVQGIQKGGFTAGLVPHTLRETNLGTAQLGQKVNLEIDLIARYLNIFSDEIRN